MDSTLLNVMHATLDAILLIFALAWWRVALAWKGACDEWRQQSANWKDAAMRWKALYRTGKPLGADAPAAPALPEWDLDA